MVDNLGPESPFRWIQLLEERIDEQTRYAKPWEQRYENEFVLPFIAAEYRDVYGARADAFIASVLEAPRAGAAAIGIDALVERLTVLGGTSEDTGTSEKLNAAWLDNDMDVMHREAHRDQFVRRESFVALERSRDGRAIITIESSEQAAVHRDRRPPYDVDAYLKVEIDEWTGQRRGLLQRPNWDYHLAEGVSKTDDMRGQGAAGRWVIEREVARPGAVPVVQLQHRPRLLKPPKSEIEPIYTLVDIDDLISGLEVFAGHFGAVPIRWATGLDIPRDPKDSSKPLLGPDGKPIVGFNPRADKLWFNSNPDSKFGQMVPASLDTFASWKTRNRADLRALTKVASTYYALDLKSHMSAALLTVDEAPMVRRVNTLGPHGNLNQAWRRVFQHIAFIEKLPGRVNAQWDDPNTLIPTFAVDAFQKAVASGLGPVTAAEKFLGWSPEDAEKAVEEAEERTERAGGDLFSNLMRPTGALELTDADVGA